MPAVAPTHPSVDTDLAGDTVTAALEEMKALAVNIQSSVAGSDAEAAYLKDFNALGGEIDKALKVAPGNLNALANRGTLLLSLGRPAEALTVLEQVLTRQKGV